MLEKLGSELSLLKYLSMYIQMVGENHLNIKKR